MKAIPSAIRNSSLTFRNEKRLYQTIYRSKQNNIAWCSCVNVSRLVYDQ